MESNVGTQEVSGKNISNRLGVSLQGRPPRLKDIIIETINEFLAMEKPYAEFPPTINNKKGNKLSSDEVNVYITRYIDGGYDVVHAHCYNKNEQVILENKKLTKKN